MESLKCREARVSRWKHKEKPSDKTINGAFREVMDKQENTVGRSQAKRV